MTDFLEGGGYEKWLGELGVTDSPLTRAGLTTALQFFHIHMPTLPRGLRLGFLKGMDLHQGVRQVTLGPPEVVAAFRKATEDPFKLFYTRVGTSMHDLGVNPSTRGFQRYRVAQPVVALESRASAARDTWTEAREYVASGGGTQLVIPNAHAVLALVTAT
ncbi:MAG TPA: hypothetical protein VKA84_29875 [Gemmatimonadaceae bacterium]|nr:hypothetical protein [Gemmatimonadaceae bacterium]